MTERELLTRAAEAAGLQIEYWAQEDYPVVCVGENKHGWNPLKFNSDALALAVRMEMDVFVRAGRWTEAVAPMGEPYKAMHGVHGDAETATRFAITMAALGKPSGNPADWSGRMRSKPDMLPECGDELFAEADEPRDAWAKLQAELSTLRQHLAEAGRDGWTDAEADAARLALELECLLTDKDVPMPALSRWWDSAHEALELHRARFRTAIAAQGEAKPPAVERELFEGE